MNSRVITQYIDISLYYTDISHTKSFPFIPFVYEAARGTAQSIDISLYKIWNSRVITQCMGIRLYYTEAIAQCIDISIYYYRSHTK